MLALGLLATGCVDAPEAVEAQRVSGREAIVGGANTTISAHPWQVFLRSRFDGGSFCGGSIIGAGWILTAAHCVEGASASGLQVVAGITRQSQANSGQVRNVQRIISFPGYLDPSRGRDIALLELSTDLELSGTTRAIELVTPADTSAGLTAPGVNAIVTGWGALRSGGRSPDILQAVTLPLVSNAAADQAYFDVNITSDMIGAGRLGVGGVDSCQGDSGGPLTVPDPSGGRKLAGVVSWGYGCADRRFPGMYARVSAFTGWIEQFVPLSPAPPPPPPPSGLCVRQGRASGLPVSIPDNDSRGLAVALDFSEGGTIQGFRLSVDVQHTYRGDLVIDLVSPGGRRLSLTDRDGGSADDYVLNEATTAAFDGTSLQGRWRLELQDLARQDVGQLRSWRIDADVGCSGGGGNPPGPWSASTQPNLPTVDEGQVCDSVEVRTDGDASDVEISLSGVHSWRAALRATLSHDGQTATVFGTSRFPRDQGSFSLSNEAVAGFSGNARGTWRLCLIDTDAFGDVGTLERWAVRGR